MAVIMTPLFNLSVLASSELVGKRPFQASPGGCLITCLCLAPGHRSTLEGLGDDVAGTLFSYTDTTEWGPKMTKP